MPNEGPFWATDLNDATPAPSGGRCDKCKELTKDDLTLGRFGALGAYIRVCPKCRRSHNFVTYEDAERGSAF